MDLKLFKILSFILITFLLLFYIFQVSDLTQKIYLKGDYQERLKKLSEENEVLEINLSKSDSLNNIENYLISGNFVRANPKEVKYIKILEGTVFTK